MLINNLVVSQFPDINTGFDTHKLNGSQQRYI